MKKLPYLLLSMLLICCSRTSEESDFRMMIRLWDDYSNNPLMTDALLDAFAQYDFCDEVWFKAETPLTHSPAWHFGWLAIAG